MPAPKSRSWNPVKSHEINPQPKFRAWGAQAPGANTPRSNQDGYGLPRKKARSLFKRGYAGHLRKRARGM